MSFDAVAYKTLSIQTKKNVALHGSEIQKKWMEFISSHTDENHSNLSTRLAFGFFSFFFHCEGINM